MSFGLMKEFIEIIDVSFVKDNEGFKTTKENILAKTRAYKEGRHGSVVWANRSLFTEATDLFRFRVIPNLTITTNMIIRCNNMNYKIYSVENVKGKGMYIEVLAKVVEPSG